MAGRPVTLLLSVLLGLAAWPAPLPVLAAANDTAALLELKAATGGTGDSLANWTAGTNPCSTTEPWSGVTCSLGRVIQVNLSGYSLSGSLPTRLDLSALQLLDLSDNELKGGLPTTLALPELQRLDLGNNQLIGSLPVSWAANFPLLADLGLDGNKLAGTLPLPWVADAGFATPFRAAVQPGNALLCGAVAPAPNHTLWFADGTGGGQHEVVNTLGSCAQNGNCGVATVNNSAPNLYDLAWSNRVAPLDLEWLNPGVQLNGAPKLGSPVVLPCYPSNAPTFLGADAAYRMAAWQSSTDGAHSPALPVSGNRRPTTPDECSATAESPAYWVVDLQRTTQVEAVLIRAGPMQLQGVAVRVSETPDPSSGVFCKTNITFDPGMGKILVCDRPNKGRYVSIYSQSKLSLCVVEVYPLAANAALGKPTSVSAGDTDSSSAAQVVNGNMANTACATVVSGGNLAAWITVDLGYEAEVETVVVQNGFSDFNNDLEVRLGNTPVTTGDENEPCSQDQTLGPRVTLPISCVRSGGVSATGRFLTLYRRRDQASDMYICQVLVFLASGPTTFLLAPPAPPSPPVAPPPQPAPPSPVAPNVIDDGVGPSTSSLSVLFTIEGPNLLPLTEEMQQNILLAAAGTWAGKQGITNVSAVEFTYSEPGYGGSSGAVLTPELLVAVSAGLGRDAAQFIVGTSQDGSLEAALRDQGGQLQGVAGTQMTSIKAASSVNPAPPPPPGPGGGDNTADGGSGVPIGAVVGGVVGALAVVTGLGALLLVRRRQRRGGPAPSPPDTGSGSDSPKGLGAMEQGHGLLDGLPKPGDIGGGYSVAALAAAGGSGNFMEHFMAGEPTTQGPPQEVINFLADDAASDHSAMVLHGSQPGHPFGSNSALARESPSGWGGSSTGGGSVARTGSDVALAAGGGAAAAATTSLHKQKSGAAASRMDSAVQELWTVNFRDLGIQKQIGEGSFGKVYLAKWRETTVAVKVLSSCGAANAPGLDDEFPDADAANARSHPLYQSLQKEAAMMASLRHPSIVMYLGVCLAPPAVVTEYCARGSLNDVLKRARTSPLLAAQLDWARRLNMALDAAKGMLYLHSCSPPIIHRDLKSANLLVDKHWRVRVCDFNLSRVMEDSAVLSSVAATNPRWLAPEILSGKGYTKASDVYSFGICMWEVLTWQVPYHEFGPWQVVAMVTESSKRPEVPPPEELPSNSFGGQAEYLALMQECWAQDPVNRPTFEVVISRLRQMLGAEASVRRESPTKALRMQPSVLSMGSSAVLSVPSSVPGALDIVGSSAGGRGDDTPGMRSRHASLTTASELGASPDPLRGAVSIGGADTLPSSPSTLSGLGSSAPASSVPPPPPLGAQLSGLNGVGGALWGEPSGEDGGQAAGGGAGLEAGSRAQAPG